MQDPQSRDEKTVTIATGLGLFCLVLAIGGIALWGVESLLELSGSVMTPILWALIVAAVIAPAIYVFRAGRR